jgi:cytochrome bd-type quinol oxidase subunit 1
VPFLVFTLLYLVLGVIVVYLLRRHIAQAPRVDATAD